MDQEAVDTIINESQILFDQKAMENFKKLSAKSLKKVQ